MDLLMERSALNVFRAVIFDCDGVLVHERVCSETLENQVFVECVADLGLDLTVAYSARRLRHVYKSGAQAG